MKSALSGTGLKIEIDYRNKKGEEEREKKKERNVG